MQLTRSPNGAIWWHKSKHQAITLANVDSSMRSGDIFLRAIPQDVIQI